MGIPLPISLMLSILVGINTMVMIKAKSRRINFSVENERIEEILGVKYLYEPEMFRRSGVIGMGIGLMIDEQGEDTEELGIIIYSEQANPNPASHFPAFLENVKVQVRIVNPSLPTLSDNSKQGDLGINPRENIFQTMIGGISGGPDYFYVEPRLGTIGLVVRDKYTKKLFIMSCCRVIGGKKPQVGDGVSQPARKWLGYRAAELERFLYGNILYQGKQYFLDVAVALPTNGRAAELGSIYGIDKPILASSEPYPGQNVMKSGIATGVTAGVVEAIYVDYITPKKIILYSMFTIRSPSVRFSDMSDRGSAIFSNDDETYSYVGLLNGTRGDLTMCSPISPILKRIKCSVI